MKTSKLVQKTEEILSEKKSQQRKRADALKELLAALKKKKRKLNAKLKETKNRRDREHIRKELAVIRVQRHKGLKILKEIK